MNKEIWHRFHEKLNNSYPHVCTITTREGVATILQIPDNEDASAIVSNLRLTVMGVGLCARITTFIKGTPIQDAVTMMKDGQSIPEPERNHIVIMESANNGNLIKSSNELGSKFTPEEVAGIESVLINLRPWSLDFIGERMIAVGFEKCPAYGRQFDALLQSYGRLAEKYFFTSKIDDMGFARMIKSQTLWFGDMEYPNKSMRQQMKWRK